MLLNSTLALNDLTEIILEIVRADVPVERLPLFSRGSRTATSLSLVAKELVRKSGCRSDP